MEQLRLSLTPKLLYDPGAFIVHSGVRLLCDAVMNEGAENRFSVFYITGAPRSGKSHFAVWIAAKAAAPGKTSILFDGQDLEQQLPSAENSDVVIVDDVDRYFLQPAYSDAGTFVHFVEKLRVRRSVLILLSRKPRAELPVDEHVSSRLIPGEGYFIKSPDDNEMNHILSALALQRGIMLKERKRKYLLNRLSRDIGAVEAFLDRVREISTGQDRAVRYSLLRKALTLAG